QQLSFPGTVRGRGGQLHILGIDRLGSSAEEDLKEFFRQVDSGARTVVPDDKKPVVLAGVDYLHPLYRAVSGLNVLAEGIVGNPEELSAAELHRRAWP